MNCQTELTERQADKTLIKTFRNLNLTVLLIELVHLSYLKL